MQNQELPSDLEDIEVNLGRLTSNRVYIMNFEIGHNHIQAEYRQCHRLLIAIYDNRTGKKKKR